MKRQKVLRGIRHREATGFGQLVNASGPLGEEIDQLQAPWTGKALPATAAREYAAVDGHEKAKEPLAERSQPGPPTRWLSDYRRKPGGPIRGSGRSVMDGR